MFALQGKNARSVMSVPRCHYCGTSDASKVFQRDHFIPRSCGGSDDVKNRVLTCRSCNVIKGRRLFQDARLSLLLKRLGWPRFTQEQIIWLEKQGFDVNPVRYGKLYFEEHSHV